MAVLSIAGHRQKGNAAPAIDIRFHCAFSIALKSGCVNESSYQTTDDRARVEEGNLVYSQRSTDDSRPPTDAYSAKENTASILEGRASKTERSLVTFPMGITSTERVGRSVCA